MRGHRLSRLALGFAVVGAAAATLSVAPPTVYACSSYCNGGNGSGSGTGAVSSGGSVGQISRGGAAVPWGGNCGDGGIPGQKSALVAYPVNGPPPTRPGPPAVLSPAPLPLYYTFNCFYGGQWGAQPPTPPAAWKVDVNTVPSGGTIQISSQTGRNFLVDAMVEATTVGGSPGGIDLKGNDPTNTYSYEFGIRFVRQGSAHWNWQENGATDSPSHTHSYNDTYGQTGGGIPAAGVTISMYQMWRAECKALVYDNATNSYITNQPNWGDAPCQYGAGYGPTFRQDFAENSPPAPHPVLQVEGVPNS